MKKLVYLIGASGSGKDSLLVYARSKMCNDKQTVFAHRYITRRADSGGENYIELSKAEFDNRLHGGLFALHWQSHGYSYGIGIEIDHWLNRGLTVVVNGSRAYLEQVLQLYPQALIVIVEVSPLVLKERLVKRARESIEQINQRLERHAQLAKEKSVGIRLNNDGQLEESGEQFVDLIKRYTISRDILSESYVS